MLGRWGLVLYIRVTLPPIREFCLNSSFLKARNLYYHSPFLGQMAVLKNTKSRDLIQEMWDHEKAHLAKFEELLVEYQVSFKNSKTTLSLKWKC